MYTGALDFPARLAVVLTVLHGSKLGGSFFFLKKKLLITLDKEI